MTANLVFNKVFVLLLIMLAGFIARKTNVIKTQANKVFTNLLIYITMPVLIVSSYQIKITDERVRMAWMVFVFGLFIYFFTIIFAYFISRIFKPEKRAIIQFSLVFSNCAFMGFPVINGIFGKEGVFLTSIFIIHFNVLLWTYGLILFTGKKDIKSLVKVIKNPCIIAIIIGIFSFIFQIKIPVQVLEAMDAVGGITITLSMIMIGSTIAATPFKFLINGIDTYICCFIKLIILPVIVLAAGVVLKLPPIVIGVCTLLSGMPVAANTVLFSEKFNKEIITASKNVALSTIVSIITIPLIAILIQYIT